MGRDMTSLLLSEVRLSPEAPEARVERVLIDADQPALALTIDPAAFFPSTHLHVTDQGAMGGDLDSQPRNRRCRALDEQAFVAFVAGRQLRDDPQQFRNVGLLGNLCPQRLDLIGLRSDRLVASRLWHGWITSLRAARGGSRGTS
jgi:hypothetical protein